MSDVCLYVIRIAFKMFVSLFIDVGTYMYLCTYVCVQYCIDIYIYLFVCMHAFMGMAVCVCLSVFLSVWLTVCMCLQCMYVFVWMYAWIYALYVCTVWIYKCLHIYLNITFPRSCWRNNKENFTGDFVFSATASMAMYVFWLWLIAAFVRGPFLWYAY